MKRILFLFLVIGLLSPCFTPLQGANGAGVYGGGPFYKERNTIVSELRNSGFKWVCVWTIHIESNGDLGFNGEFNLVQNGTYIGNSTYPNFPADMQMLKTAPTSIEWIEFGLSGWGSGTFAAIRSLVNSEGTAPGSTLYENFKALKEAIPACDAISFDDESEYHEPSATQFAIMLADLGYKVSVCPYTSTSFWQGVVANTNSARPGTIEDVHLQCYAGGSGNNPCTWDGYFASEINVMPGVEDGGSIGSQMASWNNQCGINGGWLWLYDDFYGNSGTVQSYAAAINNNITPVATNPPSMATSPSPASGAAGVSTSTSLSWSPGSDATSHDVYFGTDATPDAGESQGNQTSTTFTPPALSTNTTYYWRIDEVNSVGTTTGDVWSFTTTSTTEVDHTDPVGSGIVTARAQINTAEGAPKAFDNLYASGSWSKWLDNGGIPSSSNPSWIQIQLPSAVVVDKLAIVSANDDFGRDPEDFNLQGSNNGTSWTNLGSWSAQAWTNRFEKKQFSFSNSSSYNYFRLNITKNDDNVSMTQLCEIELFGPQGTTVNPPIADFSANTTNVVEGASVTFSDNSSNVPTSWSWTFTGGSPSSSTAQNPTIVYNTAGTYNVSLTVTNSAGTDTETKTGYITVTAGSSCYTSPLNLIINFDNYPEETSWTVKQGSSTVASGGTYGSEPDGSTKTIPINLSGGDFTFTINDSYGDGICCGYGNGSFKLEDNNSIEIFVGGDFGSSTSKDFCVIGTKAAVELSELRDSKESLRIYPNPVSDILKIDGLTELTMIQISDISGKKLMNKMAIDQINLSELESGIYFLKVENNEPIRFIKR